MKADHKKEKKAKEASPLRHGFGHAQAVDPRAAVLEAPLRSAYYAKLGALGYGASY